MTDPRTDPSRNTDSLLRALNEHGHAFAASVLRSVHKREGFSGLWTLEATEFAGEMHGRVFHVDGVLQCLPRYTTEPILAAVECKRADPAVSRWCFIRNSFVRGDNRPRRPIVDRYTNPDSTDSPLSPVRAQACSAAATEERMYQLGVELKTNKPGTQIGRALNDAVTQASLGASGLVDRLREWREPGEAAFVIPVIATTAELFASENDLSTADIATGELAGGTLKVTPVPWLWYETHLSRHLSPVVARSYPSWGVHRVGSLMDHQQARAVMIANGTQLGEALEEITRALGSFDTLIG